MSFCQKAAENDAEKKVERRGALDRPGALDGPFPANQAELGQGGWILLRADLPQLARLDQAVGNPLLPRGQKLLHSLAERLVVGCHLQIERADHLPMLSPQPFEETTPRFEKVSNPQER
jgi:hypothetical protein